MNKRVRIAILAVITLALLIASTASAVACPPPDCESGCVRSPGYWKTHDDWVTTDSYMWVGGVQYTEQQVFNMLNEKAKGDKWFTLFRQVVAAKLNAWYNDADVSCIGGDLDYASWLLGAYPGPWDASGAEWQGLLGEYKYERLDAYNNGMLCEPACD